MLVVTGSLPFSILIQFYKPPPPRNKSNNNKRSNKKKIIDMIKKFRMLKNEVYNLIISSYYPVKDSLITIIKYESK